MLTLDTPNKNKVSNAISVYEMLTTKSFAERLEAHFDETSPFACNEIVEITNTQKDTLFPDDNDHSKRFIRSNAFIVRDIRNQIVHNRRGTDISEKDCEVMLNQIAAALHWMKVEGGPEAIKTHTNPPTPPRKPDIRELLKAAPDRETE